MVLVGDSLHDGEIAEREGVRFVGVAGTFSRERFALRFPGLPVVDRLAEIARALCLSARSPSVKVALLAAGLGSRLGTLTADLPKALVAGGGPNPARPRAAPSPRRLAPAEVVVVGGFGFPLVAAEIDRLRRVRPAVAALTSLRLLENRNFRQGNLLSLEAARPHLDDDFLLLNVDHIFRPSIAALVAAARRRGVTAFIDTDRSLGADDMKVKRDAQGRVARIAKTLTDFDAGYVGMTRVPAASLDRYFAEMDAGPGQRRTDASTSSACSPAWPKPDDPPLCRDISGHGWLEVDTPTERDAAETALKQGGWM